VANLLAIGRFSRLCRLSVKALRLYDELGLLEPAQVDSETGYRYYRMEQASTAERIRLMRSLDMPLEQIRSFLQETDPEAVRAILVRQREQMRQQMAELTVALEGLDRMIGAPVSLAKTIGIKDVAAQTVLGKSVETDSEGESKAIGAAFFDLYRHLFEIGMSPNVDPPFCIVDDLQSEEDRVRFEVCVPISSPAPAGRGMSVREIPAIRAAYTMHAGPYDGLAAAERALADWMQQKGLEPIGPERAVYVVSVALVKDPCELRTEIQWPIATAKKSP
jgi:DNA-binding transcriptional MerR regulator